MTRIVVEADGASRGNPGDAAGGCVISDFDSGEVLAESGVLCGQASNNFAEYAGMIQGLKLAYELYPSAELIVRMDSKLVVEQMSGRWKIKHPDMKNLAEQARKLIGTRLVTFQWVPRGQNARADAAANRALDANESYTHA